MISDHIQDALDQVREIQRTVLARRRFEGYSVSARVASGFLALGAGALLSSGVLPVKLRYHLLVWGSVCAVSLLLNFAAVARWYRALPENERQVARLRPVVDSMVPILMAGLFTIALSRRGAGDLLFGMWMSFYGLANFAARDALPRGVRTLGYFYALCGAFCLIHPQVRWYYPWPMGMVFGVGEIVTAALLYLDRVPRDARPHLWSPNRSEA